MAVQKQITATVKAKYETGQQGEPLIKHTRNGDKQYYNIMLDLNGDTRYATVWSRKLYEQIEPKTTYVFDATESDPGADRKWLSLRNIASVQNNPKPKKGNGNGYDSELSIKSRMANTALMQAVELSQHQEILASFNNESDIVKWCINTADSLYTALIHLIWPAKKSKEEQPYDDPEEGEML